MALILAIESDKKQATRLAALARDPLSAELVIGESTDEAFDQLGNRHPDLILTSLLLSPRDESTLAERLREFDASGWRVQTLVIPVFSSTGRRQSQSSGLLTRLRKTAPQGSARGCDPQVFAEQIAEYLERAATERAVALEDAEALAANPPVEAVEAMFDPNATLEVVDPDAEFSASFNVITPSDNTAHLELGAEPQFEIVSESELELVAAPAFETEDEAVEIPLDEIEAEVEVEDPQPEPPPASATILIEEPEPVPTAILIEEPEIELPEIEIITADGEDIGAPMAAAAHHQDDGQSDIVEYRATRQEITRDEPASPPVAIAAEVFTAETDEASLVIQGDSIDLGFVEEVTMSAQFAAVALPVVSAPDPVQVPDAAPIVFPEPPPVVKATPKKKDRVAAVAPPAQVAKPAPVPAPLPAPKRPALVQQPADAMRLVWAWPRLEGASTEAELAAFATDEPMDDRVAALAPPAETRETAKPRGKKGKEESRKKKKAAPAQDEWGFFDPEQCGFAALVAKLDEIAKEEPNPGTE